MRGHHLLSSTATSTTTQSAQEHNVVAVEKWSLTLCPLPDERCHWLPKASSYNFGPATAASDYFLR